MNPDDLPRTLGPITLPRPEPETLDEARGFIDAMYTAILSQHQTKQAQLDLIHTLNDRVKSLINTQLVLLILVALLCTVLTLSRAHVI